MIPVYGPLFLNTLPKREAGRRLPGIVSAVVYPRHFNVATFAQLGVSASILTVGLLSLYSLELEKDNPDEYGTFAFSVVLLYVVLSGLFFLRIVVIRMDSMYI